LQLVGINSLGHALPLSVIVVSCIDGGLNCSDAIDDPPVLLRQPTPQLVPEIHVSLVNAWIFIRNVGSGGKTVSAGHVIAVHDFTDPSGFGVFKQWRECGNQVPQSS